MVSVVKDGRELASYKTSWRCAQTVPRSSNSYFKGTPGPRKFAARGGKNSRIFADFEKIDLPAKNLLQL